MEFVSFGVNLHDAVWLAIILHRIDGVHIRRIEAIADFRLEFAHAFIGEDIGDLVVDILEANEVVLNLIACRRNAEGAVVTV